MKHGKKEEKYVRLKKPQKRRGENGRVPPVIDSPADKTNRKREPEKNVWKCYEKMSMKNRSYLISFTEITLEKIMLHRRHDLILMKKREFEMKNQRCFKKYLPFARVPSDKLKFWVERRGTNRVFVIVENLL